MPTRQPHPVIQALMGEDPAHGTLAPPRPAWREIKELRRLITHTRRLLDDGSLDHPTGSSLIIRASNSIARLLLADHRISPTPPDLQDEFHALIKRLLTSMGYGPDDPET